MYIDNSAYVTFLPYSGNTTKSPNLKVLLNKNMARTTFKVLDSLQRKVICISTFLPTTIFC